MSRFGMTSAVSPDTQAMLALLQDREQTRAQLAQRQSEQGQQYDLAQQEMAQRGGLAQQELNQRQQQFDQSQGQQQAQFEQAQGQQQQQFTAQQQQQMQMQQQDQQFAEQQQRQLMQWQSNQMAASQQHAKDMMQIQLAMAEAEGQQRVALEQQYMQAAQQKANIDAQLVAAQAMFGRTQQEANRVVDEGFRQVERMETMKKQALDLGVGLAKAATTLYQSKRTQRAAASRRFRPLSTQPTEGAEWEGDKGQPAMEEAATDMVAESLAEAAMSSAKAGGGSVRELQPLIKAILSGYGNAPAEGPLAGKQTITGEEAAKRISEGFGIDPHTMQAMLQTFANAEGGLEAESRVNEAIAAHSATGTWTEGLEWLGGDEETDATTAAKRGGDAIRLIRRMGAQGANAFTSQIIDTEGLRAGLGLVRSRFAGGQFAEAEQAARQLTGGGSAGSDLERLAQTAGQQDMSVRGLTQQAGQRGAGAIGAGMAAQGSGPEVAGVQAARQLLQQTPSRGPVVP